MFKGLVMEIKNNTAIVMKDDGSIIKIKYKDGINVGDKIIFLKEDIIDIKNYGYKKILSIAALFMVAILLYLNFKPTDLYAVVSLDVNPSIDLKLDKN
ncbi:anti-sigma factor domain-containing protein [Clostridium chauvoei]|uniref:RsgI N-terminal anti-sigma domain-containing protein n=2 Tax=Clostridium chauvoei TaxID=46867 RepID=S6F0B8_9CLOT|nr:anti-sigma factor domain-containing protein [Clostridium chauvoei]ATD55313.1 hypothetical protein BTM20_08715 [Clostridium chauvoei]ATD57012.1 hypothetical protein BTM21_04325 [Clostridium chauvoei]MBX7280825.1 anti-sigma factor domain-containing protein [Clostridium chauvoei]MBX7283308.1 anti-sigma factor domain-containing protein [Clostridium chauvoei]MBX7285782.1 anti-sigma factor domain-containing protein [Clostridium chauvoei]